MTACNLGKTLTHFFTYVYFFYVLLPYFSPLLQEGMSYTFSLSYLLLILTLTCWFFDAVVVLFCFLLNLWNEQKKWHELFTFPFFPFPFPFAFFQPYPSSSTTLVTNPIKYTAHKFFYESFIHEIVQKKTFTFPLSLYSSRSAGAAVFKKCILPALPLMESHFYSFSLSYVTFTRCWIRSEYTQCT